MFSLVSILLLAATATTPIMASPIMDSPYIPTTTYSPTTTTYSSIYSPTTTTYSSSSIYSPTATPSKATDAKTPNGPKTCTYGEFYCGYSLLDGTYGYEQNTILQEAMTFRSLDPAHRWDALFWCGDSGSVVAVYDCQTWEGLDGQRGSCHPPNDRGSGDHCQPGGQ